MSVHASHTRSDDEIHLLILAKVLQIRQSFKWVDRDVGSNDCVVRKEVAEHFYCSACSG